MPTSSEFVSLCESQVALLTQGLGAALSIVYLTEEFSTASDAQLIPIVAYPEAALNWGEDQILSFLTQLGTGLRQQRLLSSAASAISQSQISSTEANPEANALDSQPAVHPDVLLPQQQIVLPLIWQERVMGLLITARADRAWSEAEQAQIEQIAQTLTTACVLDRRAQWLAQDLQRQQLLEERKTDLFDDLLHQFRNPLTALRTFGKLLVRRLRPGDANRSVAESIVHESDRLQELLKQLDAAIDLDTEDLVPLLTPRQPEPSPVQDERQTASVSQPRVSSLPPSETRLLLGSTIDLQPHAITEVLQPLLDSAIAIAQDRQLALQIDVPLNLPPVLIDVRALREVLSNLLDNALKYTPAGGSIYVGVQRQTSPKRQIVVIADTGPGIPPEDLAHLFERHYRGVQAKTDIPGTGLGLAIAQDLIRQMQSEIQIFSPAATSNLVPIQANHQPQESPGTAAVIWLVESDQNSSTLLAVKDK